MLWTSLGPWMRASGRGMGYETATAAACVMTAGGDECCMSVDSMQSTDW